MHMCKCFWSSHFTLQQNGSTALTKAATEGHAEVVLELLRAGAAVNEKDSVCECKCAIFAVYHVFLTIEWVDGVD